MAEREKPGSPYTADYHIGFNTDRLLIEPSDGVWEFLFQDIEEFVLRDPYVASYEIKDSGGARFLFTEPAGFLDVPPLIVFFQPDDDTRVVRFLTVQLESEALTSEQG